MYITYLYFLASLRSPYYLFSKTIIQAKLILHENCGKTSVPYQTEGNRSTQSIETLRLYKDHFTEGKNYCYPCTSNYDSIIQKPKICNLIVLCKLSRYILTSLYSSSRETLKKFNSSVLDVCSVMLQRVAANILNKQSRTADKGWTSSLGVGPTTPHRKDFSIVTKCFKVPRTWTDYLV
jgi:hypothetical protein